MDRNEVQLIDAVSRTRFDEWGHSRVLHKSVCLAQDTLTDYGYADEMAELLEGSRWQRLLQLRAESSLPLTIEFLCSISTIPEIESRQMTHTLITADTTFAFTLAGQSFQLTGNAPIPRPKQLMRDLDAGMLRNAHIHGRLFPSSSESTTASSGRTSHEIGESSDHSQRSSQRLPRRRPTRAQLARAQTEVAPAWAQQLLQNQNSLMQSVAVSKTRQTSLRISSSPETMIPPPPGLRNFDVIAFSREHSSDEKEFVNKKSKARYWIRPSWRILSFVLSTSFFGRPSNTDRVYEEDMTHLVCGFVITLLFRSLKGNAPIPRPEQLMRDLDADMLRNAHIHQRLFPSSSESTTASTGRTSHEIGESSDHSQRSSQRLPRRQPTRAQLARAQTEVAPAWAQQLLQNQNTLMQFVAVSRTRQTSLRISSSLETMIPPPPGLRSDLLLSPELFILFELELMT
ncbi:unnamed protein product [Cuscuta campestris]|uniref:Uncharacterized protein n=1 Tax=Cuscuta campestris TaxID=132261 RepID=A0A484N8T7_9ASTE|nr:unnamed protein product [Cuscuta campestris]